MDENDEAACAVMRRHFHIDARDINEYDLGFNSDRVSVPRCVDLIVKLVKSDEFAETEESRGKLRDAALAHHVRAALRFHGSTGPCSAQVTAINGYVILEGTVDRIELSDSCSDVASRIKGVKLLENRLQIT